LHFGGKENSAERRLRSDKAKETGSGILHLNGLRLAGRGEDGSFVAAGEGDVVEDVVLVFPVAEFGDGRRLRVLRMGELCFPDCYGPIGLRIGKRAIEDAVHDTKDGTVAADGDLTELVTPIRYGCREERKMKSLIDTRMEVE
jgi:hypothetical protein